MHLPKSALLGSCFRRACDELGPWMRPLVRKMSKRIGKALPECFADSAKYSTKSPAIGTEEIAVGHHSDDAPADIPAADVVTRAVDRTVCPEGVDGSRGAIGLHSPFGPNRLSPNFARLCALSMRQT